MTKPYFIVILLLISTALSLTDEKKVFDFYKQAPTVSKDILNKVFVDRNIYDKVLFKNLQVSYFHNYTSSEPIETNPFSQDGSNVVLNLQEFPYIDFYFKMHFEFHVRIDTIKEEENYIEDE
jgi:hypothetical protein